MAKKGKTMTDAQKSEKWTELAEARLNRSLKAIRGITKLANSRRYHWTPKQLETIKKAYEAALDDCFAAYEGKTVSSGEITLK